MMSPITRSFADLKFGIKLDIEGFGRIYIVRVSISIVLYLYTEKSTNWPIYIRNSLAYFASITLTSVLTVCSSFLLISFSTAVFLAASFPDSRCSLKLQ